MAAVSSPQPLAVGETIQNGTETQHKQTYAAQLQSKQSAAVASKIALVPVNVVHGELVIQFTMEEVNNFIREEGLHQAVVVKFSYRKPDLQEVRKIFSSQFDIQGHCNVGQLDFRHLLIRFDLYNDYVHFLSKSTGYLKSKGEEFFFRTFPWTLGFNPKEETSMAVVWISLPGFPPNFFAKRSLMSIASAVGKALAVDKATQDRTRPSAARVKVIIDLLDKHPKKVKLQIFDQVTGKSVEFYQEIVYDNLPKYCTYCKHQGHDEKACRIKKEKARIEVVAQENILDSDLPVKDMVNVDKLQGDARDYLNAKRTGQGAKELQEKDGKSGGEAAKVVQQILQIAEGVTMENNAGLKDAVGRIDSATQPGIVKDVMTKAGDLKAAQPTVNACNIDKGPPKPSRDVPASVALARISNAVNPIVEAYDKLASAAQILSAGTGPKNDVNRGEATVQIVQVTEDIEKVDIIQQGKAASELQKGAIDMAAGHQSNAAKNRVTGFEGLKVDIEAKAFQQPTAGNQTKIAEQTSDRQALAQIS